MSDWKKRNEDWRDEDELEEEEECECPWVDSKGKVRETAYCQYLLEKHPMMCLKPVSYTHLLKQRFGTPGITFWYRPKAGALFSRQNCSNAVI